MVVIFQQNDLSPPGDCDNETTQAAAQSKIGKGAGGLNWNPKFVCVSQT